MKTAGIITGVLMIIVGICSIFMPMRTFLGLGWFVGILILVHGIEMGTEGIKSKPKKMSSILLGILGIIIGLAILFSGVQRLLTDMMLAYMIGGFIIVYGIVQIIAGSKIYQQNKSQSIFRIVCGVISAIAGLVSVAHPTLTMVSVGYIIAFTLVSQGVSMVALASRVGKEAA